MQREFINFESEENEKSETQTENAAELVEVNLQVVEPQVDKNYMVAYEGQTEAQCRAYNFAIREVLSSAGLKPFFQVGSNNQPGYHAFECLEKCSPEQLSVLLPEIHKKAQAEFQALSKN
ncbi:hypothetical protein C4546_00950 [Candidatus Parcubacteria bacterium]|jgi:hypothetical protein|nr:MAG: hypothetical protein C4546_00950 [Candidatus Parcubacteria bacterium]